MEKTEKLAEFVGLHFGDGSLIWRTGTSRLRFQLRGDAVTDRAHYEQFVIPLCNDLIGRVLGRPLRTVFDKNRNCFGISVESGKLYDFFQAAEIPIGEKHELPVPHWIKENPAFATAFVRGLFDTGGGIYFKRNNTAKSRLPKVVNVDIVSTSKLLATDVSMILTSVKIKHYVFPFNPSKGTKTAYRVQVYKPHVTEFMEKIGSHNPKHLTKFWIWKRFGFCPSKTTPLQRQQILKDELSPFTLLNAGVR